MVDLINTYNYYLSIGDNRVKSWPLMSTPVITSIILVVYLISIKVIKIIMENRTPFALKSFLYFYNFVQVALSLYIFIEILIVAVQSKYSLICQVVDYSNNPLSIRMASVMWVYYMVKVVDLFDTVIFALRKKSNQITFLHVFHHFSMVCNGWVGVYYVPGGQTFFLAMLNSFIHSIMYFYYGLTAMGPSVQKYLWWKRYLTQLQLLQFMVVMSHALVNIFSDCTYPKGFSWSFVIYGILITALFTNFYIQSYKKKPNKKE